MAERQRDEYLDLGAGLPDSYLARLPSSPAASLTPAHAHLLPATHLHIHLPALVVDNHSTGVIEPVIEFV